jgi:hypothetical protein
MHVGLDLGSSGARVLTVTPQSLQGKRTSLNYALLPDTNEQRRHLARAGIHFASCEGYLLLLGNAAGEYSRIFRTAPQSLLPYGELPHHDILGRQILASHINQLLPNRRGEAQNAICCYSHPQSQPDADQLNAERNRFLSQVLHLANYIPLPLSAGMAVILAEMVDVEFTGISLVFGSSCTEMTIAFQGRELFRASAPVGGDWIDDELARRLERYLYDEQGIRYPDLHLIRHWRERLAQPLMQPRTKTDQLICEVYAEFLTDALNTCLDRLESRVSLPRHAWTLVCAGGLTRTNGFKTLLHRVLMEMNLPFEISHLRPASQNDFTIARGCLANAFLESSVQQHRQVA